MKQTILISSILLFLFYSCAKKDTPSAPAATNTPNQTATADAMLTAVWNIQQTQTSEAVQSHTRTYTSTSTVTGTITVTHSITHTLTITPTDTPVYTPTFTATATMTCITIGFRQGENAYAGARDTYLISTGICATIPPFCGFGTCANLSCGMITVPTYGMSQSRTVLDFDISTIPDNADVQEAYLVLYADNVIGTGICFVYINGLSGIAWNEGSVCAAAETGGTNWYEPWINDGGDTDGQNLCGVTITATGGYNFPIPPVWMESKLAGNTAGFLLIEMNTEAFARFQSKEAATIGNRPKLVINYVMP